MSDQWKRRPGEEPKAAVREPDEPMTGKPTVSEIEAWLDRYGPNSVHLRSDGSAEFVALANAGVEAIAERISAAVTEAVTPLVVALRRAEASLAKFARYATGLGTEETDDRDEARQAWLSVRTALNDGAPQPPSGSEG